MSMQQMLTELTEVTPTLFISSATAITENKLQELGINLIVNATKELLHFPTDNESIHRVRVPIYDNAEATLYPYFKPICDLISRNEENGGKTLVHCLAGRSRSASLILAYLILQKKMDKRNNSNNVPSKPGWGRSMDLYESLDDLKRLRPLVQPNSNFLRQLTKWETDVSKNDVQDYNPYDFFSYQMNKSERVHLEAIQYIESITCQIAESATSRDKNGNDTSKNCCREAFINESSSSLGQCENCSKCQVK